MDTLLKCTTVNEYIQALANNDSTTDRDGDHKGMIDQHTRITDIDMLVVPVRRNQRLVQSSKLIEAMKVSKIDAMSYTVQTMYLTRCVACQHLTPANITRALHGSFEATWTVRVMAYSLLPSYLINVRECI